MRERLLQTAQLDWLPIGESERMTATANALRRPQSFDLASPVWEHVEMHACDAADAIAVTDDERTLTYGQLAVEVRHFADVLTESSPEGASVIAVAGPRCAWSAIAFLAIERIGAVYLAVDHNWPALRIQSLLESSGASLLVYTQALEPASPVAVAAEGARCGVVSASAPPSAPRSVHSHEVAPAADTPKYLLYTSGSTGKPKGAVVEHQGMMNHLWAKVTDLQLTPEDRVAQNAPLSFDVSIWQMLVAFLVRGAVCFLSDEDALEPGQLIDAIGSKGITVLEVVPTVLRFLLDEHERRGTSPLQSLRCAIATGEVLPPSTVRRWITAFPRVPLMNAYGPTECSDDVTHHYVSSPSDDQLYTPIGSAVPNAELYLLVRDGEAFRACRPGETGELFVGGVCVGRGYVDDAERTRTAFFRDPFSATPTGRLYRTGDVVRLAPPGVLEFVGRIDRQVKAGGVRIELGEIEELLRQHGSVSAAAVVSTSAEQGRRLIAYVCGDDLDVRELKAYLTERLPRPMVPQTITPLRELPLTPNGKVDYQRLETQAAATSEASRSSKSALPGLPRIGRPIGNTRAYILDDRMAPVPIGVAGELYVGGAGVPRGFHNDAALTAAQFIRNPFRLDDRLYKTGDRARYRSDGTIEYLGRNDSLVWDRGARIDLEEIEARLAEHGRVTAAIVVAQEDRDGRRCLVAYYVSRDAGEIAVEQLRSHLAGVLPSNAIPEDFRIVEAFPLTPAGKVDRKALSLLAENGSIAARYEPAANGIEETVARIWSDVLGVERISRRDNFFDLGGYSVLTMAVAGLLKRAGFTVTVADLYKYQTVRDLSGFLQGPQEKHEEQGVVTVRSHGHERPLFLVAEWSGFDTYFSKLGEHIDAAIPVYGLLCVDLGEPHPQTMEGLADRLIRRMRTAQPAGPYRIAGWSWGGTLAYEIATQLIGQDETVEFLGLFDTEPGIYNTALHQPGRGKTANGRLLDHLLGTPGVNQAQAQGLLRLRDVADTVSFEDLVERVAAIGEGLLSSRPGDLEEMESFFWRSAAHAHAAEHYVELPISIPVHLFVAEDQTLRAERPRPVGDALGWIDIVPRDLIRIHPVPGDHHSIMGEHIGALGEALSSALNSNYETSQSAPGHHYEPLVTISSGALHSEPVYCVPGAGDSASQFIGLASALGDAFCVRGFQYRGLDYVSVPHSTVEAAASAYIRAIEDVRDYGPIHLIGHSLGGWIAFEMAQRLRARRRPVASLTIIDSEAPIGVPHLSREWTTFEAMSEWIAVLQLAIAEPSNIDLEALRELDFLGRVSAVHRWLVRAGLESRRSRPEFLRGPFRTFCTGLRAVYRPSDVFPDSAHFVLLPDTRLDEVSNQREHDTALRGWRTFAPSLVEWRGPGNHMTILKPPHVEELANWWLENVNRERDVASV